MKLLIALLFTCLTCRAQYTDVMGWNAHVHLPGDYTIAPGNYPAIIYFPPLSGVGTNAGDVLEYGPGAYLAHGWDGTATVDGVVVEFIVINLQPPAPYPNVQEMKERVDWLRQHYRISYINLTGIEHGGICVSNLSAAYPLIAKTVSNVTARDTCCWKHYYNAGLFNIGGRFQSLYQWMALKSAFGSVHLDDPVIGQPSIRKPFFYYDNTSRIIHIKPTQVDRFMFTNTIGQVVLKGNLKVGENKITLHGITTGVYILKTESKVFKIIVQ